MDAIRKVLVVDDDPVVGKSFDRVLSGKGYAVITARNGEEALNKLRSETYDVVFTDIRMPGMSGLDTIPCLRRVMPDLSIIALTVLDTNGYREAALAAGANEFVAKGNLSADLLPAIRRVARSDRSPASGNGGG